MIYTTNATESPNRIIRKAIRTRGSFPSEKAAEKLIYLAIRGHERTSRTVRAWLTAVNQFALMFEDRFKPIEGRERSDPHCVLMHPEPLRDFLALKIRRAVRDHPASIRQRTRRLAPSHMSPEKAALIAAQNNFVRNPAIPRGNNTEYRSR